MSVASKNPFALLNDDDEAPVTTAPAKDKAPAAAPAAAPGAAKQNNNRGRQQNSTSRGGRYYKRGGAPTGDAASPVAPNPNEPGLKFDKDRGRGRGRGGGGGGRGRARDGAPLRGRTFDKQSQTGVTDSDKQIAQGWGAETGDAELADENAGWADAKDENVEAKETAETEAEKPAGDAADAVAPRREEEEEDNTLTLDQYLAQQKEKENAAVPKLEGPRQISDDSEWKNSKPIERAAEEEFFASNKGKNQGVKEKAKREEKQYIDWTGGFERPQRGGREFRGGERGGRGTRGAPRRGGRGGARGNWGNSNGRSGNQSAGVNVEDESAFPSLG